MRLAIIAEKLSLLESYSQHIVSRYPSVDFSQVATFCIMQAWFSGNARFKIPHDLKYADLPYVGEPAYRPMGVVETRGTMGLRHGELSATRPLTPYEGIQALLEADEILILCDASPESVHMAARFLVDMIGEVPLGKCKYPWTTSFPNGELRRFLDDAKLIEDYSPMVDVGAIRRYFDYNYLVNSLPIHGATAHRAGLRFGIPSKYGLQALYACHDLGPTTEGQLMYGMSRWTGTGKYHDSISSGVALGSAASRGSIVKGLRRQLVHLPAT